MFVPENIGLAINYTKSCANYLTFLNLWLKRQIKDECDPFTSFVFAYGAWHILFYRGHLQSIIRVVYKCFLTAECYFIIDTWMVKVIQMSFSKISCTKIRQHWANPIPPNIYTFRVCRYLWAAYECINNNLNLSLIHISEPTRPY